MVTGRSGVELVPARGTTSSVHPCTDVTRSRWHAGAQSATGSSTGLSAPVLIGEGTSTMLTSLWRRFSGQPTSHPWRRVKILVVDEELPVCQFVDRVLSDAGCVTEVASSLYAALARQLDPDSKVLYLTGYSDVL
jgi:hypothetical protein